MKKIFTLAVAALAAMSANAQDYNTFVNNDARQEFPTKMEAIQAPKTLPNGLRKAKAVVKDETATYEGTYVHSVWVYDENYDYIESSCDVVFTKQDDGTYAIQNFVGRGTGDYKATLDAETGQLVAQPGQLLFTHQSYGDVSIYACYINDDYEIEVDLEREIRFSIDGDRIMIDNDGIVMVITSGQYTGYILNTYMLFNQFDRVNATMTCTNNKGENLSYNVAWDGDAANDGEVDIYGFRNYTCVTIVTDAETGLAYMPNGQDALYYDSQYGMFSTVGLVNENGTYYLADSTAGTFDVENNVIKLGLWGFGNTTGTLIGGVIDNTEITGPALIPVVGIDAVAVENKCEAVAAPAYDLMGRQTEATRRGQLYIREGRKFIVR